ncbi:MAG: cytidylyltransferase domain-containing protein, partial [Bacteroidota bacterium]
MNTLIIQARMGSSRLPGKVLREIATTPILQILINRIKPSQNINEIVVATTSNSEDDVIE